MRKPHLLIGLVALALMLCASWFAFGAETTEPPPSADYATLKDASFDPADVSVADASAHDLDSVATPVEDAMREEIAVDDLAQDAQQTPTEGPLVIVVRKGADGKQVPAPGVEIAWIGMREGEQRASRLPANQMHPRGSEQPFEFGRKSRTSEDGTIRLPPLEEPTWVAARDGDLFGIAVAEPNRPSLRVALETDETVIVRVKDDQGRGVAQAPLSIVRWIPKQGFEDKWTGFTDRRGECAILHFQYVRAPEIKGDRYAIAVTAPQKQPSWLEFQARPAPTEPLVLTLSQTRELAVRVVHHSGAPILSSLHVSLRIRRPEEQTKLWAGLLPDTFEKLDRQKPRGSEPVRFAHAGYGVTLQPFLHIPGERAPRRLPEITLPEKDANQQSSPTADLTLTLPKDVTVVALQPIGPDGTPLVMADIPWQLRKQLSPGLSGNLETTADGRGDFLVPAQQNGKDEKDARDAYDPTPLTLMLRETLAPDLVLGAEKPLGALQRGERRDLGPVAMAPLPMLCSGRVVDDRGEPRKGAALFVTLGIGGDAWVPAPHLVKSSAEDGTFAFYAPTPQFPFRVQTRPDHEYFEAITGPLSPGTRVEIVTTRTGILQGRVIPPAGLPENALTLTLVRDPNELQPGKKHRPAQTPIRRRNGWFWLGGLEAGTYTAVVTMRGLATPLAMFEGVRIAPGPNEDPRLSPLDLSQSLFRYELRAVAPNGQPMTAVEGPILWRGRNPDGSPLLTAFRWKNGTAAFFLPVPYAELVIVGPGLRATEVAVTPATREVVLDLIVPFPVELPGVRSLAGPTRAIRVSAVFLGETGLPDGIGGQDQQQGEGFSFPRNQLGKSGGGWLDAADRTGLVVSRSGKYELTLRLYESESREGRQSAFALGQFDVDVEGRTLRPLVVPVDLQRVQQALESLRPQPAGQSQPGRGRR